MPAADATCWSLIRNAAAGDPAARDLFARAYLPAVRAYLAARWQGRPFDADDAAQDVFVECFKAGGLLEKAETGRPGGFRAFLIGAAWNVARRHEDRLRPAQSLDLDRLPADDPTASRAFDRAWTRALLREAARVQAEAAALKGDAAVLRVDLLRLRFHDGLPIREIAQLWGIAPAKLHHEYATAREEFRAALREVISFHNPGHPAADLDRLARDLFGVVG